METTIMKSNVQNHLTIVALKQSLDGNDVLALAMEDFDEYDIEAFVLGTLGDIANTIARIFPQEIIPASWGFSMGAGGAEEAETLFAQEIEERGFSFFHLREAGNALSEAFKSLNS